MSVITRLNKIFSKKESAGLIGVTLRQQGVAFCNFAESPAIAASSQNGNADVQFEQLALANQNYQQILESLSSQHKLEGQCHLVLPATFAQIVQVDKPNVPENEINAALKWQVKDLVSIAPDNMVVDYFDSPALIGGQEKINVVCAPMNELKSFVAALVEQNIQVKSIITEEFAFARLLPTQNEPCLLVCRQPSEEVLILIIKKGQICFHRRLRGFTRLDEKSEQELSMGTVDSLSLEIQRSTDYFERQLKQAPIREIRILLPMATEAYLARKLAENTNVAVELLDLPTEYKDKREYACALGATMPDTTELAQ